MSVQILRRIASQLRRQTTERVIPHLMHKLSYLKTHRHAVYSWPEDTAVVGRRVVLFVHFDRNGAVQPYVLQYLHALKDAGLSILFVSNAEELKPTALESIKPLCAGILLRRNVGYDFGAMREGLEHFGLPRADTDMLIIANDSVYGPLVPLDDMLSRIDFSVADLWGTTDSWQQRYHLQSYFLVASPALMRNRAWAEFWRQVRPVANKRWVIARYEVGITQWMLRADIGCAAMWPYSRVVRDESLDTLHIDDGLPNSETADPLVQLRRRHVVHVRKHYGASIALNPTSDLWRQLLRLGFPFVKRELLRDNPSDVADVADWRDEVATISPRHVQLIEQDLRLVLRNRAP